MVHAGPFVDAPMMRDEGQLAEVFVCVRSAIRLPQELVQHAD
jgi:hypothetical protein